MPDPEYLAQERSSIRDVAARAGVSRQTVTRAMNNMPGISEKTRQRVLEVARELHYRPSRVGRALAALEPTPTLGLIIVDLTNPFWAELASRVLEAAEHFGWTVLIVESTRGGQVAINRLTDQVDAMIGHLEVDDAKIEEMFGPMPLVLFEREPEATSRATISLDFAAAIEAAVDHLLAAGRRDIVMLDWSLTDQPSRRAVQYAEVMRERGLQPRLLQTSTQADPDLESGRVAAIEARQQWPQTDALLCFNDAVAIGAIKELASANVAVPDEVAVVGIDGLPLGLVVTPELTTLQFDFKATAMLAVELVTQVARGQLPVRGPEVHRSVKPQLTVRRSG